MSQPNEQRGQNLTERSYPDHDPVVAQYERWTYPTPANDLRDPSVARYVSSFRTLEGMSPIYWPAGRPREDLDILVAGCGTMAAAAVALFYPNGRVTGIDISRTSLEHEQRLKDHHQLSNLTLRRCAVEDVVSLNQSFDYVSCHGVLHHLPDPAAGLRAIGQVLRPQGIVGLMLYARYGRQPVYVMQDLFRQIGLEQTTADLAVVREVLANLPADHPLRPYLARATDLGEDAGVVDTFLHRRDRSYTVTDCLDLLREAGLAFGGWDRNYYYHPEGLFAQAPLFQERLRGLSDEATWAAVELAFGMLGNHWFHACRADRDPATYQIPWDTDRLLACVPLRPADSKLVRRPGAPAGEWSVTHRHAPPIALTPLQAAAFGQIDARRTIGQCVEAAGLIGEGPARLAAAREVSRFFWRVGLAAFRLPP